MNFDWKSIVKNIAPGIGAALGSVGGPAGALAGKAALSLLANKFVGKPDATEQEIAQAINTASPDQLIKLKELDVEFGIEMGKRGVDLYALEVQDRSDARKQRIEIAKTGKFDWAPEFLTVVVTLGFFSFIFMVAKDPDGIPESVKELLYIMAGAIATKFGSIVDFYFGSSSSARNKDNYTK